MANNDLLHEQQDNILLVTFNRPNKLNALTFAMLDTLSELLTTFRKDPMLQVMLIRSTGKFYSTGLDISEGLAPETDSGIDFRDWYRCRIHTLFDEMEAIEKPIISAAQGPCLGGALEMALSCDFRLAATSASYGLPETNIGALPGSGGTSRLTRLVGAAEAKWFIMAAQKVDAQRALRTGLVHEVYPDKDFDQASLKFAQHLAKLPSEVLGVAKLAIEMCQDMDRASARNLERIANTPLSQSQQHKDLVNAFLNRKKG